MTLRIDVAATTVEALEIEADAYAVIDCLRATTTIAALFESGLTGLWTAADIETARTVARRDSAMLFGEVHGMAPEGFDYGNSPVEALAAPVAGKRGVLFTTNGTLALTSLAEPGAVFAAAAVNASAVVSELVNFERVVFVCAGVAKGTRFGLEDFAVAAHVVQAMAKASPGLVLGDLARLASGTRDPLALIAVSEHAEIVRGIGLPGDVEFAMKVDTAHVAPRVVSHAPRVAYLEAGHRTRAE